MPAERNTQASVVRKLRKLHWLLFPVALLLGVGITDAQSEEEAVLRPPIDLSVDVTSSWDLVVQNNSNVPLHNVKVRIDVDVLLDVDVEIEDDQHYSDGVLTISRMDPKTAIIDSGKYEFDLDNSRSTNFSGVFRLTASIISSSPQETPGFQYNNRAERWGRARATSSRLTNTLLSSISVLGSVTDRRPPLNGQTTFTVAAKNTGGFSRSSFRDKTHVELKITLAPGMAFNWQSEPDGIVVSGSSAIWSVGELPRSSGATRTKSLDVPVSLSGTTSLDTRCLTAEVYRVRPPDLEDKRFDDTARVCLGDGPQEVFEAWPRVDTGDALGLFTAFPCIGVTAYPCNTDDTLELVVRVSLGHLPHLTTKQRRDDAGTTASSGDAGVMYLQPNSVVIHVDDPPGRLVKDGSVVWSTSKVMEVEESFRSLTTSWTVTRAVTVTAHDGGNAPGRWTLARPNDFVLLNAVNRTKVVGPAQAMSSFTAVYSTRTRPVKVDFSEMGTYKALYEITGVLSGTTYKDSATYTFHVGPLADLEVRDAGRNPAVAGNQRAYTIEAVNHGPSDAGSVEVVVTGVPEGARIVASQGSYDPDTGIWRIGDLEHVERRPLIGKGDTETLTIILDDGGLAPITATIRTAGLYTVCIDSLAADVDASSESECTGSGNSWHTGDYYEPYLGNNTANIAAQQGTGEGDPNAPKSLNVMRTAFGNILVWRAVERLNGFPVTHYEIETADPSWKEVKDDVAGLLFLDMSGSSANQAYRVRAVNSFGVPGPWTMSTDGFGGLQPPSVPRSFTATLITDHDALLTWSSADRGEAVTHYVVQAADHAGGPWSHAARVDGDVTRWIHPNLPASGADKFYRIRAHNPLTHSEWAETSVGLKTPDAGAATGLRAQRFTTRQGNHGIQVWLGPYACGIDEADCLTLIEFRQAGSSAWFFGSEEFSEIGVIPWDPDASYFTDGAGRNAAVRLDAAYDIRVCKLTDAQIEAKHTEGKPEGTWCVGHTTGQLRVPAGE